MDQLGLLAVLADKAAVAALEAFAAERTVDLGKVRSAKCAFVVRAIPPDGHVSCGCGTMQLAAGEQPMLVQLPPGQRPAVHVPTTAASLTADSAFVLDLGTPRSLARNAGTQQRPTWQSHAGHPVATCAAETQAALCTCGRAPRACASRRRAPPISPTKSASRSAAATRPSSLSTNCTAVGASEGEGGGVGVGEGWDGGNGEGWG